MPFSNGVFNRLRRWAGETNISQTEFDQDGDDVASALSNCLLRDGTGVPKTDISWNGKKLTNLAVPASVGDALPLGLMPMSEVVRALGYTPAQPVTTVQASFGGASDIGTDRTYLTTVDFTATAANFLGAANTSFQNSTSGSAPTFAYLSASLLDLVSNAEVGISGVVGVSCNYGLGYNPAVASFVCAGLTLGRNYRFRLFASKSNGAVQIPVNNAYGTGINF